MSSNWTIFIHERGVGNNVERWWSEVILSVGRGFNSNGEHDMVETASNETSNANV